MSRRASHGVEILVRCAPKNRPRIYSKACVVEWKEEHGSMHKQLTSGRGIEPLGHYYDREIDIHCSAKLRVTELAYKNTKRASGSLERVRKKKPEMSHHHHHHHHQHDQYMGYGGGGYERLYEYESHNQPQFPSFVHGHGHSHGYHCQPPPPCVGVVSTSTANCC
jgi:hypothetical protein